MLLSLADAEDVPIRGGRGMRIDHESPPPGAIGALIARLRRRPGRVGAAIALLTSVAAAIVVFAVVACKTTR
jgi:hypothetical protein